MKKLLFLILLIGLNFNLVFAHGFGAHAKNYETIVALNLPGSYLNLITDPQFMPYFIYGSIFPDIQYAVNYKQALSNIYQKIRNVKLYQISELNINENAFEGLTYEIDLHEIPNLTPQQYAFGFDTHNENYALKFAEYLFTESAQLSSGVMTFGNGATQICEQGAFALGYYAHIAEDIAAHNFLIPKITAQLNLGDLELIKKDNSPFNEDPNSQMEGIIEALIDHHFGDNYLVAQTVYSNIWVRIGQLEPSVPLVIYDGVSYPNSQYWGLGNPMFDFFLNTANQFLLNNPAAKVNDPIGLPGLLDLADIFRFVNRFYPAVVGKPFNGFQRIDQVLADWISNHLDLSDAANFWGITLSTATGGFLGLMNAININVNYLSGLAYPSILAGITPSLLDDPRSMMSLMLSNMGRAAQLASAYPDKININSYNTLKRSDELFRNGQTYLQAAWNEYKELGCRIYAEVGPTGATQNWYYHWSPWRKQTMTWGVYSSLNNSLPEIYESNPNVAVYDSYFKIGNAYVQGYRPPADFQNNSFARINLDLFNTKDVAAQSLNLVVKKDHNSINYGSDGAVNSTGTFSIDQNPITYGSVSRLTKYLDFQVSINDLVDNKGYYFELKNQTSNKPIFTSSFEQYQNRLTLTPNYYRLYDTYKKWPYSLGVERNVYTVTLNPPKVEDIYQSGSYLINGLSTSSIVAEEDAFISLEAIPGNPNENFFKWTDGNTTNPRQYKVQSVNNIYAIMKKAQLSNNQNAYANNSQRKFVRTENGYFHNVYQSMDRIWYERSTNNGANWEIMNAGKPLSNLDSKSPSIAVAGNKVLIVFQEKNGVNSKIILLRYDDNYIFDPVIFDEAGEFDQNDLMPIISYNYSNDPQRVNTLIIWRAPNDGLYNSFNYVYGRGTFGFIEFQWGRLNDLIQDQGGQYLNNNSTNLAVSYSQSANSDHRFFSLAWEQRTNSEVSKINHCSLKEGLIVGNSCEWNLYRTGNIITVSDGCPFVKNYRPSIVSYVTASNSVTSRICWIGERGPDGVPNYTEGTEKTVVFTDPGTPNRFWTFGNGVTSTSINKTNDKYAIAWASGDNNVLAFADNSTLRPVGTINITGKDVQLSNGTTSTTMYALAFNTSSLPYYMQTALVNFNQQPAPVEEEREGIVSEGEAQIFFNIGDVVVNDQQVSFVEIPDTASINFQQTANQYLVSEPFSLNNNSEFFYSVRYGITDSLAALGMLNGNTNVTFKVELLDAATNELLGVFDEITYDQFNIIPYENIAYQVNTNGIGERMVKLHLVINNNFNPEYSVAERYDSQEGVLSKKQYKQINYKGSLAITEYALEQNYPNPFNPTTTINYQIKEDGLVTLKIYDILGSEVITLVNEEKTQGRYSYNFNASDLASGVYVYQLRVNDFVASKKLLLLK